MEELLAVVVNGDRAVEDFLDALAEGQVWVPLPAGTDPSGSGIALPTVTISGEPFGPVFTSAEQLAKSAGDVPHMVPPVQDFLRNLPEYLGLAVNIGGDAGMPVRSTGVRRLRGERNTAPPGSRIRLGEPAQEPTALLSALGAEFRRLPEVRTARRGWAQVGDAVPGLILGIDLSTYDAPSREAALASVREAISRVPEEFSVDTVFMDDATDSVTGWLKDNVDPFYRADHS
ncbi:enhanced serine sensitivity protein SseB C-terminal domain-containing protein [Streptomyces sp. NPDC005808]|uniref:enhanced serine sensitivity protein SseB C-terminal domain-containing protein n=1 Tax=Streptomyces sp. NPDC005808 TaxID=3364734 RepID=UPI00367CC803